MNDRCSRQTADRSEITRVARKPGHEASELPKSSFNIKELSGAGWADCPVPAIPVRVRVK